MKFAIINKRTGEFYPDPTYDTIEEAQKKIEYLINYCKDHPKTWSAKDCEVYEIELLNPAREKQHAEEWQKFISMID